MSRRKPTRYRGPSRPIDPRNAPGPATARRGPDTFGLTLIGVSTAVVLLLLFFLMSQRGGGTAATPIAQDIANPTAVIPDATQQVVAFQTQSTTLNYITAEEAKALYDAGNATIIDVRDKALYDQRRIKGASNVPYTEAVQRVAEFPRAGNVILYCQ